MFIRSGSCRRIGRERQTWASRLNPLNVIDLVCLAVHCLHTYLIICASPLQELPCIVCFLCKGFPIY